MRILAVQVVRVAQRSPNCVDRQAGQPTVALVAGPKMAGRSEKATPGRDGYPIASCTPMHEARGETR